MSPLLWVPCWSRHDSHAMSRQSPREELPAPLIFRLRRETTFFARRTWENVNASEGIEEATKKLCKWKWKHWDILARYQKKPSRIIKKITKAVKKETISHQTTFGMCYCGIFLFQMNCRAMKRNDGDETLFIATSLCDEQNCFSNNQQSNSSRNADRRRKKWKIEGNSIQKSYEIRHRHLIKVQHHICFYVHVLVIAGLLLISLNACKQARNELGENLFWRSIVVRFMAKVPFDCNSRNTSPKLFLI